MIEEHVLLGKKNKNLTHNAQICLAASAHTITILWYTHIPTKATNNYYTVNKSQ